MDLNRNCGPSFISYHSVFLTWNLQPLLWIPLCSLIINQVFIFSSLYMLTILCWQGLIALFWPLSSNDFKPNLPWKILDLLGIFFLAPVWSVLNHIQLCVFLVENCHHSLGILSLILVNTVVPLVLCNIVHSLDPRLHTHSISFANIFMLPLLPIGPLPNVFSVTSKELWTMSSTLPVELLIFMPTVIRIRLVI